MNILGIIASSKLGVDNGDFESIATVSVGSGGSSSISFTSIPATYTHLQVRGIVRSNRADTGDDIKINFNGVTTTSYSSHILGGNGSITYSYGAGSNSAIFAYLGIPAANATANVFDAMVIDVLDYANTNKNKTTRLLHGWDGNGNGDVELVSGGFYDTTAISSISIAPRYGTLFTQYSQFALYGIRT